MRFRSSSKCSIRLMPGSSTRSVTAFRALLTASDGSTIVCRRFYRLVCILDGGVLRVGCDLWGLFFVRGLLSCGPFHRGLYITSCDPLSRVVGWNQFSS